MKKRSFPKSIVQYTKSLQFCFTFVLLCAGLVPVLILTVVLLYNYESHMTTAEINKISSQAGLLSGEIITSGYLENQSAEGMTAEITSVADAYSGRIMLMDTSLRIVKDTYGMYEGRTFLWENVIGAVGGTNATYYDRENRCLVLTAPITSASEEDPNIYGVILITESTDGLEDNMTYVRSVALIGLLTMLIAVIALSLMIPPYLFSPIHDLAEAIADIDKTDDMRLSVPGYRETDEILENFNQYREKMRFLDDSRQEFVSNVSHELKTPLTSIKVLADSINSMGDNAPIEMYREFMGDITNEVDHETEIINDLLSLVRMDKSKEDLNISIVNINELLELLLKRLEPLAVKQNVDLVMESFRPVTAEVDEVKFSLAIMNLIENAIKYNNAGGWVHVSINSDHQYCFIRVEDNGMGISEEAVEHIFERFYRGDKSHSREISGTGLGLAITRDAITLHHGEIRVTSTLGEGTVFDVRIPLSYISEDDEK